ncbi:MAG: HYR domain-containing protein, partial [Bacteroidota bacterium]
MKAMTMPRSTYVWILTLAISMGVMTRADAQSSCVTDTSFTDIIFLIDNSQSIDDQEFDAFDNIILESIRKVQQKCVRSQIGVVHYGGAFGRETEIGFDLSTDNVFDRIQRRFCTTRNSSGFCTEGGGDDLNNAIGDIIDFIEDGDLSRNPNNDLQLVIFTDAFGFSPNCDFINCSVIRPFNNIDFLKTQFGAQVTVVGASSQAEASLLAIYASPGGEFDQTVLFDDCEATVDGCALPRKYIPIEFTDNAVTTSDNVVSCVECRINIIEPINPDLGENQTICGDLGESALIAVEVEGNPDNLTYSWEPTLPSARVVTVRPAETTTYRVTVTDPDGCTGTDEVTVFVESCAPDCSPDTSFTDILFLIDNSQSIDDQEYSSFEQLILTSINKVQEKCRRSQVGVVHYGGAFGAETNIEYTLSERNRIDRVQRQFCTSRNSSGFCSEGGGDDLNNAIGDILVALENGDLNRNPNNSLQLVIFTDAFGFDPNCSFINCSVIRPFNNIDLLKTRFGAQVTVVGASSQAEASLLAIYASPGGSFNSTVLFDDCANTVDGCALPRKYIPVEFTSPIDATSDSIVGCVECEINILEAIGTDLGGDQTICSDIPDDEAVITVTNAAGVPPFIYMWSNGLPPNPTVTVKPDVTTTYTVVVMDANTCTDTASVTVIVEDCIPDCVDPPVFVTCAPDFVGCPDSSIDPVDIGRPQVEKGNEQCPELDITFVDDMMGIVGCNQTIRRTWTATYVDNDDPALVSTCIQMITIGDREPPVLVGLPQDIMVESDLSCTAVVTWEEPMATDNCGVRRIASNISSGSVFDIGTTTVMYTATDVCGNIAMGLFRVTVVERCCTEAPVITCADDFMGCPGSDLDPSVTGEPTAEAGENCPMVEFSFEDEVQRGGTDCRSVILRRWTASYADLPGMLIDQCTQTITLADDTAPEITDLPDDITIDSDQSCTAQVSWRAPSGTDDCGMVTLTSSPANNSVFDVGETVVTYTATDECGNMTTASFTVTVVQRCCVDPPIITCPDDFVGCPGSSIDPSVTGVAIGEPGGPDCPNPTVSFDDEVVMSDDGCTTMVRRTWTALYPGSVEMMLISTCEQNISLIDTEAPVFTSVPDDITIDSDASCTVSVTWPAAVVDDDCGGVTVESDITNGSRFDIGTTVVTLTATDACGNSSSATFTVTVIKRCCTDPPIVTCPDDFTGCPGSSIDPSVTGLAVGEAGGPDCPTPTVSFADERIMDMDDCSVIIERTWTALYPGGADPLLTTSCIQTITLTDEDEPTFTSIPEDITVDSDESCTAAVTWPAAMAEDDCGDVRITSSVPNGSRFDIGETTVTLTATDRCGNMSTATFSITIIERCCTDAPL